MKAVEERGVIHITLSRRNLLTLLAKLDREDSARTLLRQGDGKSEPTFIVTAEEDDLHYEDRKPGFVLDAPSGS